MLIGIIGAMIEEIEQLKENMKIEKEINIGDSIFFKGNLLGKDIVLVESGIGKVNASICATLLIQEFKVDKILFTGVAGGINENMKIGDIVISTDLMEHDFDCSSIGFEHGIIPRMKTSTFKADNELVEIAKEVAENNFNKNRVFLGRIVSGDKFVASKEKIKWLKEKFNGECTEMEGAAVAHVCYSLNKPFVVIRSISDGADENASTSYEEFVKVAAKNSKIIIEGMLLKI